MQPSQVMQCGICKTFHFETAGPCPACQSHKIHQLAADRRDYPTALRQAAQLLRREADEMEREASAFESNTSAATPSADSGTASSVTPDPATVDPQHGGLTRRSA